MSVTALQDKTVKTRSVHMCAWCGASIDVGEMAQYRAYIFDGDFNSDYLHIECEKAITRCDKYDMMDGFTPHEQQRGKSWGEENGHR